MIPRIKDAENFNVVQNAMTVIDFSAEEQREIFNIIASVLHMGNIGFTEEEGKAKILKPESVQSITDVRNFFFAEESQVI